MDATRITTDDGIAIVTLDRGKVNPLNEPTVDELTSVFGRLAVDPAVRAVVLTGHHSFFSFGFDVPEFLGASRAEFTRFVTKFTGLYTGLFLFPKPLVMALNGHAIAGGCMLALAGDLRLMAGGTARISLNEITFGASVFAGCVEMLRFVTGERNAQHILYGGGMMPAEEAARLGLVDRVVARDDLSAVARTAAAALGEKDARAFGSIKGLLRRPVAERMRRREPASIEEFVEIWYSESTWRNLQEIRIRS